MSFDQSMADYPVRKVRDEAKIAYKHLGAGTTFEDTTTNNHAADIEVEELLDADFELHTATKVLKPDEYEEPPDLSSEESNQDSRTATPPDPTAQHDHLIQRLRSLHCNDGDTKEGSQSWLWNSKHQWTMGTRKRSHSQSAGSETEIGHTQPLGGHDLSDGARRFRRRVRERSSRSPRVPRRAQAANAFEVEEADDDVEVPWATLHASNGALEAEAVDELEDVMDMD